MGNPLVILWEDECYHSVQTKFIELAIVLIAMENAGELDDFGLFIKPRTRSGTRPGSRGSP
jgi:hypothetical protein